MSGTPGMVYEPSPLAAALKLVSPLWSHSVGSKQSHLTQRFVHPIDREFITNVTIHFIRQSHIKHVLVLQYRLCAGRQGWRVGIVHAVAVIGNIPAPESVTSKLSPPTVAVARVIQVKGFWTFKIVSFKFVPIP